MMPRNNHPSFNLPLTMQDYVAFCKEGDFGSIRSICKKLSEFESQLVCHETAELLISKGLSDVSLIVAPYKRSWSLVLGSFAEVVEHLGGKAIFWGFIPESTKYIQGAMIPVNRKTVIAYLPYLSNSPKVLCSVDLASQRVIELLNLLVKKWKEEVYNWVRIQPVILFR